MSERSERLLVQFGQIRAGIVEEADEAVPGPAGKRPAWKRWAAMAAGLAIVLFTAGVLTGVIPLLQIGGNAGGEGVNPTNSGPTTFMSYAGPVFPLTLRSENDSITAERDITLDFLPWTPEWLSNEDMADQHFDRTEAEWQELLEQYREWFPDGGYWQSSTDILVTDRYRLTNTSGEDRTLTVLYPFAGKLYGLNKTRPVLTADGAELETVLHAGGYAGGYEGVWHGTIGGGKDEGSVNLKYPDNWEDYRDALAGGSYLANALGDYPDLSGIPAVVYELTDPWGEERDDKAGRPNPTIRVDFELDYEKTAVLSYGFNGFALDREKGRMDVQFSIPQPRDKSYGDVPEIYYLIVIGDDVENLTTQGYVTGGWDTEKTIEAGVTVRRYGTDLESVLRQAAGEMYQFWESTPNDTGGFEMYFGLLKGWLVTDGALSGDPAERYGTGALEDNDVRNADRVFYLEAEVTVPAGGSVQLTAEMIREGSHDFYCTHTRNQGVYGYDMVTELGSNLTCTAQRAAIEDWGLIEIVRQNFGFDLKNGVKTVDLDPGQEHYYLEVRGVKK